jgi:hypothetical protein
MDFKGTIRAVGSFLCEYGFKEPTSRAEGFAQSRFHSKLELPNSTQSRRRKELAWSDWLQSDNELGLTKPHLWPTQWALARLFLHKALADFKLGSVEFSNGSEFVATRGFNSIESKLRRSEWTCTHDNFDLWCQTVYRHHGLKHAMKKRYTQLLAKAGLSQRSTDRRLWEEHKNSRTAAYDIFCWKLEMITTFVQGNRFSTVPKNNEKDRPICIEPLANILTQRRVGSGFRRCLKQLGVDLNASWKSHQSMISDRKFATIDLKNASDRIILELVEYLLPSKVYAYIAQTRSAMTLGPDDNYYCIRKVSSMGNGFTFELMSLILYALCRSYKPNLCNFGLSKRSEGDDSVAVYGDDIIVPNCIAESVVSNIEAVGFVVNRSKTHINDDYRESCGAHYLDDWGYVESYDFRYPVHVGDVITIANKLSRLSMIYPTFIPLLQKIYEAVPATWYANNRRKAFGDRRRNKNPLESAELDTTLTMHPFQTRKDGLVMSRSCKQKIREYCHHLQLDPNDASLHLGFEWKQAGPQPTDLDSDRHWAKYLMYLASGRRTRDSVRGNGTFKSFKAVTLNNGITIRWSAIS